MSTQTLSLLVTDDDPHFQFFLKHGLSNCGIPHDIKTLKNGDQLLDMLSQPSAPRFHCILLDMNMPRKNGTDILKEMRLKNLAQGTPVIIMSQATDPSYVPEILKLGAAGYMEKPSGLEEFKTFAKKVASYAEKALNAG